MVTNQETYYLSEKEKLIQIFQNLQENLKNEEYKSISSANEKYFEKKEIKKKN